MIISVLWILYILWISCNREYIPCGEYFRRYCIYPNLKNRKKYKKANIIHDIQNRYSLKNKFQNKKAYIIYYAQYTENDK